LITGVKIQLEKDKEYNIHEVHHRILEEVELDIEGLQVKYDGIISKDRVIKYESKRIEDRGWHYL
jgi:hypothetical protein